MSESLREKIKNVDDIKKEIISIKPWNCDIEIRTMSAHQRANVLDNVSDDEGNIYHDKLRFQMILNSCFDPDTGEQIFKEEDEEWLMKKSFGPIEMISQKIMRLSGISRNSIEDAEKNSDLEIQKGDFITS